jgi:peptidoglycan/LPS O-acetylase OafA/YrhL
MATPSATGKEAGMKNRGEITSLTGLRGVAALCVVIGHFSQWTVVVPRAQVPPWVMPWVGAPPGIGMSIFFTLSGFVIALSYSHWNWRERPGFNLARLFFYRFARLYPAFFLFAVMIVLRSPQLRDLSDPAAQSYLATHLLLWQSWFPEKYFGQLASSDLFHISWSISTECGLYLLFGLGASIIAMLPVWRHKAATVAVGLFSAAFVVLLVAWVLRQNLKPSGWSDAEWSGWLFYLSPWAISVQFGLGVLAYRISCLALPSKVATVSSYVGAAGLILVYLLCVVGVIATQVPQALLAGLSTALLMVGSKSASAVDRILTRPAFVYVGTISYSLYLFHFVVPSIGFNGNFETLDLVAILYSAVNFSFSLALAIMLATGIYKLVEEPGRQAIRSAADKLLRIQRPTPIMPTTPGRSSRLGPRSRSLIRFSGGK